MWTQIETLHFYNNVEKPTVKLACFDLDWTLIYPTKNLFPKLADDVKFMPNRLSKLRRLHKRGHTIVIFTNQKCRSKKEVDKKIARMNTFIKNINIPIMLFMATDDDYYRKPNTGMWIHLLDLVPKPEQMMYCGDAAGRQGDFSDSDKIFAENCKIPFYLPNQVFADVFSPYPLIKEKEVVIFVGMPGSGKTTLYRNKYQEQGYLHVNGDKLKSKDKVFKAISNAISAERSIVIDCTNPSLSRRKDYYKIIPDCYKITVIYFVINGHGRNKCREKPVPDIAYHIYYKNLDIPTILELQRSDKTYRGEVCKITNNL